MEPGIHTIPLRDAWKAARKKRAARAVRIVKEYAKRHSKRENVKIGLELNHKIWERGAEKPPRRVRVQIVPDPEDENVVWVELEGVKIAELEKREKKKKEEEAKKEEKPKEEKKEDKKASKTEEKKVEEKKSEEKAGKEKKEVKKEEKKEKTTQEKKTEKKKEKAKDTEKTGEKK